MDPTSKSNSYELLSMSDSDSDTPQQMQELNFKSPRRKKLRKKLPSYRQRRYDDVQNQRCCRSYGKLMSLSFIIIILCCWLLILSWLIVIFNDELRRFDSNIMAIVAGNQGIPESLQKCHSQTKELQRNQTDLYSRFIGLNAKMINLTTEVSLISNELQLVKSKLKSFSESSGVPLNLQKLSDDVLSFHTWIDDFNGTVAQLNASEHRLEEDFLEFRQNVTSLKEKLMLLEKVPKIDASATNSTNANDVQKLTVLVNMLNENVTYLNNSLTSEIQLLKENMLRDPILVEDLKSLLSQNVSTRLDSMQAQVSSVSNTVQNLTHQFNNLSSDKMDDVDKEVGPPQLGKAGTESPAAAKNT